jgi:hypothetical protein
MKTMSILLAAGLAATGAKAAGTAPADCAALYRTHLETDLKLPYEQFDQQLGGGFRQLDAQRCFKEAGDLLEAWMRANGRDDESVRWHVAQQRAQQGDTAEAIRYAKGTLDPHEDLAKHPLRWNDYVLATIAFLQHDRAALVAHRDRIAEGAAYGGNAINLRLVDALVANFDAGYADAVARVMKR